MNARVGIVLLEQLREYAELQSVGDCQMQMRTYTPHSMNGHHDMSVTGPEQDNIISKGVVQ